MFRRTLKLLQKTVQIEFSKNVDYYQILKVSKINATSKEIKDSFKNLSKNCHPDLFPNDEQKYEEFQKLNEAHEVLSNEENKRLYDEFLEQGGDFKGFRVLNNLIFKIFKYFLRILIPF